MVDVSQQISPFCALIRLKRYDDHTLRTLQVILESKDCRQLRSSLKELLRSECVIAIRQFSDKPVHSVLSLLDFFVRAFAIITDVQSCLVLRYEALVMRDSRSITQPDLLVSCAEWMKFAEDAFDNGFYSIASKACENALLPFDAKGDARRDNLLENEGFINKIRSLKDVANRLSTVYAVQVQASDYLKQKTFCFEQSSMCGEAQYTSSISFRNGIKQQNAHKLFRLQNSHQG